MHSKFNDIKWNKFDKQLNRGNTKQAIKRARRAIRRSTKSELKHWNENDFQHRIISTGYTD